MHKNTMVYIIGAGSIGKALASFLKLEGKNVVILRGSVNDQPGYSERIKIELPGNTVVEAMIETNTINNYPLLNGIIVLTNKSFGNQQLASTLWPKVKNSPIVILQNGLNVEQPFTDQGFSRIYRCVLFTTSQSLSQNLIRFKPVAPSAIGVIKGSREQLDDIAEYLTSPYFEFRAEQNIHPVIWSKAIVNCVFNSVCPLLETDNGLFYRHAEALRIAKRIIKECLTVARSRGIHLDEEEIVNRLLLISRSSDGQLISTYQDILHKRRTEIESLNLAIAAMAAEEGQAHVIQETNLLGELIQLKAGLAMAAT